ILFQNPFRIAYTCSSPYGLARAQFRYRIFREGAEEGGDWSNLPLKLRPGTKQTGPFQPRVGAFLRSRESDQVDFHAIASADPNRFPPGIEGGGRFDFQTRGLPELKIGDKLEFYIEVFDRNPDPGRPPGRS